MKLYIPKQHTGYQCDSCKTITAIPIPLSWLIVPVSNEITFHYCPKCTVICKKCNNTFSKSFEEQWFKEGICSNCQEE